MRRGNKYKQTTTYDTLVLPSNFKKFQDVQAVRDAYEHLQLKGRNKANYVTRAIKYYDDLPKRCECLNDFRNRARLLKKAMDRCGAKNAKDFMAILSIDWGTFSRYYLTGLGITKGPAKSTLGFSPTDPEAVAMHSRLCMLSVSSRIMLMTDAINAFINDGKDPEAEERNVTKVLRDLYKDFRAAADKEKFVNELAALLNIK